MPHVQTGDRLTAGDIYANVHENSLLDHRIMVPPGAKGNVTYIAPAGEYSLEDKVLELEFGGVKKVPLPLSLLSVCLKRSMAAVPLMLVFVTGPALQYLVWTAWKASC